jgi:hypothetical protein
VAPSDSAWQQTSPWPGAVDLNELENLTPRPRWPRTLERATKCKLVPKASIRGSSCGKRHPADDHRPRLVCSAAASPKVPAACCTYWPAKDDHRRGSRAGRVCVVGGATGAGGGDSSVIRRDAAQVGAEVGRVAENPRNHFAIVNSRFKSEAVSVTAHCHAATALLIRDIRVITVANPCSRPRSARHPLTKSSISVVLGHGRRAPAFDATSFTENRDRLLSHEVAPRFFQAVLAPWPQWGGWAGR